MRISSTNAVLQAYISRLGGTRGRKADPAAIVATQDDLVTLSQLAQDVRKVKDHLLALPQVREDRVAELQARLASGDYHVSDEDLADRILASGVLYLPDQSLV